MGGGAFFVQAIRQGIEPFISAMHVPFCGSGTLLVQLIAYVHFACSNMDPILAARVAEFMRAASGSRAITDVLFISNKPLAPDSDEQSFGEGEQGN